MATTLCIVDTCACSVIAGTNFCHTLYYICVFDFSDGSTQMLTGCLRDFRNKPFSTRARIEYYKNTLTVTPFLSHSLITFVVWILQK